MPDFWRYKESCNVDSQAGSSYNSQVTMKKLFLSLTILSLALFTPRAIFAQENCVSVYGGGVVCGTETHEPVETGLGNINPAILGIGLLAASGILLYLSKRAIAQSNR
jgi:LPXTG-motif cell wall-anchored protein